MTFDQKFINLIALLVFMFIALVVISYFAEKGMGKVFGKGELDDDWTDVKHSLPERSGYYWVLLRDDDDAYLAEYKEDYKTFFGDWKEEGKEVVVNVVAWMPMGIGEKDDTGTS